jgi:hypothetical protein
MSEKSESEEFDEDDAEEPADTGEDLDVDHMIKGLESLKRRGPKIADPAWRRLERLREERHTAEMVSDFDDYDIGDDGGDGDGTRRRRKKR